MEIDQPVAATLVDPATLHRWVLAVPEAATQPDLRISLTGLGANLDLQVIGSDGSLVGLSNQAGTLDDVVVVPQARPGRYLALVTSPVCEMAGAAYTLTANLAGPGGEAATTSALDPSLVAVCQPQATTTPSTTASLTSMLGTMLDDLSRGSTAPSPTITTTFTATRPTVSPTATRTTTPTSRTVTPLVGGPVINPYVNPYLNPYEVPTHTPSRTVTRTATVTVAPSATPSATLPIEGPPR